MAGDYRQQVWPLAALPLSIWKQLCDQLDVTTMGNGYQMLADRLGYLPQQIHLFSVRCGTNQSIPNSPTYMLLAHYAEFGGTIQRVQFALERMEHAAASTIPQNLATMYRGVREYYRQRQVHRDMSAYPDNDGYQNTESLMCRCPHCLNSGSNPQPVQRTYRDESFRSPRSPPTAQYQQPQGYHTPHQRVNEPPPAYREVSTPVQAPARGVVGQYPTVDPVSIPEQTHQPVWSHQHARSELHGNANMRRPVCVHCRRQADPDETIVMTVSGEKPPSCECAYENLALTSVFRQSPIGGISPDDSIGTSDDSNISSSFEIDPGDTSRWTAWQRNGRIIPDIDRHSWPSSSSDGVENEVRNCASDPQLSLQRGRQTMNQQVSQNDMHITDTIYSRISDSNMSNGNRQFHNNLDADEVENACDENDNLEQNIALSDSMNDTRSRQTSPSTGNTQLSPNQSVCGHSGTVNQVRVFVTYAWNAGTDSQTFLEEVVECCQQLKNAGARVKIDMDDTSYTALRLNKLDWIDRNMRQAHYILVCITPTYLTDVTEQTEQEESPRISQLNARYVFDKLRQEYFNDNSVNRRVIPVIFPNYRTSERHVPDSMRTTLIHTFPNNANSIVEAVFGRGRYRPT